MRRKELNVVVKKGRPGDVRVAVAYPSIYEVALSSLSYQMIYYYVNSREGFIAERFNLERLVGEEPPPRSLERGTPLKNFDLVIFSVHYEPDFVNVLRILKAGGVPVRANERKGKPIVVAGGPPIIANPEPLADFLDVAVIGEIEVTLPKLLDNFLEYREDYRGFLESLSPRDGFYAPPLGKPERVEMKYAERLEKKYHPVAQLQLIDGKDGWTRTTRIEASRGCYRGCAFCLEGRIFNVFRERPREQIVEIAVEGSEVNMTEKVTLISLSFFDHSSAKEILEELVELGLQVSVPSMRAETLDEEALELILRGGQKTLTIAPETPSLRLARLIRKVVPKELVYEVSLLAKKLGFHSLKLYFMVGIPGETLDDVEEIASYVLSLSRKSEFRGNRELKITLSPLVPKPHTPLQSFPMDSVDSLKKKIAIIKEKLGGVAEVRAYNPKWAKIQCVISRGGRELGRTLEIWAERGGGLGGWTHATKLTSLDEERYTSVIRGDYPWSFIVLAPKPKLLRSA